MKLLIIDVGHGGTDPGTVNHGYLEKDIALVISKRVKYLLEGKYPGEIDITRTEDKTLTNTERTNMIKGKYKYCISIHLNAFNESSNGVEAIYQLGNKEGKALSEIICKKIVDNVGINFRRVFERALDNSPNINYYFMHRNTIPTSTVIVECLFLSSTKDILKLNVEEISRAIAEGFIEFNENNKPKEKPIPIHPRPTLRQGDRGAFVKDLQERLNKLGYNTGVADGVFGPGTNRTVLAFQELNKLVADGIVGPASYRKIVELEEKDLTKGYRTMYQFGSFVHVYQSLRGQRPKVCFGEKGKLEVLSKLVKDKIKEGSKIRAAVNGQFFGGSVEFLGTLLSEGRYYQSPHERLKDFIYYKDNTSEIKNFVPLDSNKVSSLRDRADFIIGTSYSLIKDSKINIQNDNFFSHSSQLHPRTLLGHRQNKELVLVVIDGRRSDSRGINARESAELMKMLKVDNSVNLDGGGSTEMILVNDNKIEIVNKPSDGKERPVGTFIFLEEI